MAILSRKDAALLYDRAVLEKESFECARKKNQQEREKAERGALPIWKELITIAISTNNRNNTAYTKRISPDIAKVLISFGLRISHASYIEKLGFIEDNKLNRYNLLENKIKHFIDNIKNTEIQPSQQQKLQSNIDKILRTNPLLAGVYASIVDSKRELYNDPLDNMLLYEEFYDALEMVYGDHKYFPNNSSIKSLIRNHNQLLDLENRLQNQKNSRNEKTQTKLQKLLDSQVKPILLPPESDYLRTKGKDISVIQWPHAEKNLDFNEFTWSLNVKLLNYLSSNNFQNFLSWLGNIIKKQAESTKTCATFVIEKKHGNTSYRIVNFGSPAVGSPSPDFICKALSVLGYKTKSTTIDSVTTSLEFCW